MTLQDIFNVFCPTGEGGGVDASCGGNNGGGGSSHKVGSSVRLKGRGGKSFTVKSVTKTGKLVLTGLAHEGTEIADAADVMTPEQWRKS